MSPTSRWASRPSGSASAGSTSGSPRRTSGGPRPRGWAARATAATGPSPVHSSQCRWAVSTAAPRVGGVQQETGKKPEAEDTVPDGHGPVKRHAPMMLSSDLALKVDPIYEPLARRFYENPDELAEAFARAWYKLLHRDMGPVSR